MSDTSVPPTPGRAPWRGLHPFVIRLGWVSFFTDLASEMLYPLTPLFLTSVLGAPVAVVGAIEGLAEATASLLKTASGRWSDRLGRRRPFIVAGYTLSALAKPLIGWAVGWPLVLAARVGDRFGKGLRASARDALIADVVEPADRGRAYGWHRAMDTSGAVLGPLLALLLLQVLHSDLRLVFKLALLPGLASAALVFTVRDRTREPAEPQPGAKQPVPPAFRRYLLGWGLFSLANSSDVFLFLKARQVGLDETAVVLVYAAYNLVYAVASPSLGTASDRLGRRVILVGGLLVFAAVYVGFAAATQAWQIWLCFGVYGLYAAATDGVGKAYATELVPADAKATAVGLLGTVTGLATLVASVAAGLLWHSVGPWAPFALGAVGALAGAAAIAGVRRS